MKYHFVQDSKNPKLVLFWRGGSWKPTFSYIEDFTESLSKKPNSWKWAPSIEVIVGNAARPYIKFEHEITDSAETDDRIHMAFTDGHPRDVPTNSIYYACLDGDKLIKGKVD